MVYQIPVIDLFAGPGGLSEGFASLKIKNGFKPFDIRMSIEKDHFAHKTLELRSFFRQFAPGEAPRDYFAYLRGGLNREELFKRFFREAQKAQREAWHATLGETSEEEIDDRIFEEISHIDCLDKWVLLGGPPCQAYSLAGRSRIIGEDRKRKTNNYENDHRHLLYREYLRILAVHTPAVFVMENVQGILSSEVRGEPIFDKILSDLKSPVNAIPEGTWPKYLKRDDTEYRIFSFVHRAKDPSLINGSDFVIRSEEYGVPQARHRVFLLGIRADLAITPRCLKERERRTVSDAIFDLPHIRSILSREPDDPMAWQARIRSIIEDPWFRDIEKAMQQEMLNCLQKLTDLPLGGVFVRSKYSKKRIKMEKRWFFDVSLCGYCNHESRGHISEDLKRYLFAACFAKIKGRSPVLSDFPKSLHPAHRNINPKTNGDIIFDDRFHVQISDQPSTTIVSHIAKDGHYFIHPDPLQCRSLSVREAARLQTFPDNYFFEGARTQQYKQVGNAVPPLLARQIAEIVYGIFEEIDLMLDF